MSTHHPTAAENRIAAVDRRIEDFYVAEARLRLVRRGTRAAAGASRPR